MTWVHKTKFVIPFFVMAPAFAARTVRVPSDFASINAAVLAVDHGGTVLVSRGTYTERITIPDGKKVSIIGELPTIPGGTDGTAISAPLATPEPLIHPRPRS